MFTSFTDVPASLQSESAFVAHWLATRQNFPGVGMFVCFFFRFFFSQSIIFCTLEEPFSSKQVLYCEVSTLRGKPTIE